MEDFELSFPFDRKSVDNEVSWRKLPKWLQSSMQATIGKIVKWVDKNNPGRFRFTSGFRSDLVNRSCGGVIGSKHLYGLAIDFVPVDGDFGVPPSTSIAPCCGQRYRIIRSPQCWHCELVV